MDEVKSAQDSVNFSWLIGEVNLTQNTDQPVFGPQGEMHCKSGCRLCTITDLYHYGLRHCDYCIPKSDNDCQIPLTFLSFISALDIAQFPHGPSGRPQFQSWWIFPDLLDLFSVDAVGQSPAVVIPLIIVAFNVNDLIVTPYYKWKVGMTSSHAASDPGRQLSRGSDDASKDAHGRSRSMFPMRRPNKPEDDKVSLALYKRLELLARVNLSFILNGCNASCDSVREVWCTPRNPICHT
ncbi:uncharacterized protein BO88DRAFT_418146 [Aspergillus vadensis CBS 113365]|uniref:Uncharacterized protein n=1 Tax=Aspergillus vadensis (strain CBS 113365 / IMI 142717 / IBT 24658) TaxID=1448311 RepID=A0A319BJW3_ASPVC|nr:hypothetical protein BO88DRAFT_418146 [Aspergillus vadensis CBS 113365]PYH65983.1 hypothetical protein BO88DRAFT_418146 [Aspergillus vadensis CBS 113365]